MFETIDAAEMNIPLGLMEKGQHLWQFVTLRLHVPWFYILYQTEYEGENSSSDFVFVTKEEQILEMLKIERCKIIDIYLVSPSHLNENNCWKMEKLKEIWTATLSKQNQNEEGKIYVLQDGREYTYSLTTLNNEGFTKNELLIKI